MKDFDLKKYLAENKLLKEDDPRVSSINIGDKFQDEDTDIWTVKDIFIPEWTTEVETITLENEDGELTVWPDDFDGGGFFEWFNHIEKLKEDINSILRDGGYDEIDDEDLLIKVERKYEEGMSAEELNDLTMDIESEEGGNIYF